MDVRAKVVCGYFLLTFAVLLAGAGCSTFSGNGLPGIDVRIVAGTKYEVAGEVVELSGLAALLKELGCGAQTEIRIELPKQAAATMFSGTIAELRRRGFPRAVFVKQRKIDVVVNPAF